jgi:hypothetical protein
MAWEVASNTVTLRAASNLSNRQWRFVKPVAAGTEQYGAQCTTSLDIPIGVLRNSTADSSGEALEINTGPIVKVYTGEVISAGSKVRCGANGTAMLVDTTGQFIAGVALSYGSTNDLIAVFTGQSGYWYPA